MINYYDWAEHQSKMHSNKVAITDYSLNKKISYKELKIDHLVKSPIFCRTWALGIATGLLFCQRTTSIFFELQFACSKIGSIMVPLNWRLTANELAFILNDCEPSLLIVDDCFKTTVSSTK